MEIKNKKLNIDKDYLIPLSIIIAGGLIGFGIYMSNAHPVSSSANVNNATATGQNNPQKIAIQPITKDDHIRGSLDAPVKIVEYSDLECPFCKQFHSTLEQIFKDYNGQVAWVYRQMPLSSLHSKAPHEAEASECAAYLGGNDGFWKYVDRLFTVTNSNNSLDPAQLYTIADYAGLDHAQFASCLDGGKFTSLVSDETQKSIATISAANSNGVGTPYSVIVASDGTTYPLVGAQPYDAVKSLVDLALKQK